MLNNCTTIQVTKIQVTSAGGLVAKVRNVHSSDRSVKIDNWAQPRANGNENTNGAFTYLFNKDKNERRSSQNNAVLRALAD